MRPRTKAGIAGIAAVALIVGGFVLFRSTPTASLILPAKAAVGANVEAKGKYSESEAGLEVTLSIKGNAESLGTTTTDGDGSYKLTFKPGTAGAQGFVITVVKDSKRTLSVPRKMIVLAKTGISAKVDGNEEAAIDSKRSLSGKIEPVAAARTVVLEVSPDATAWSQTEIVGKTDADGGFKLKIDTSEDGERYYRAKVEESASNAEAVSFELFVGVYDYKAAGRYYLKCVKELNAKFDEYRELEGFSVLKGSAGRMAERSTKEANCIRGYSWPPSVADDAEQFATARDQSADTWNQMSGARTIEEYNDLSYGLDSDAGPATRIRAALGLPKRPAG